jgi:hypothetical protein
MLRSDSAFHLRRLSKTLTRKFESMEIPQKDSAHKVRPIPTVIKKLFIRIDGNGFFGSRGVLNQLRNIQLPFRFEDLRNFALSPDAWQKDRAASS